MISRSLTAVILAAALIAGLATGMSWSAFSSQTQSSGSGFSAAATFSPEFVGQLGSGSCTGGSSTVTVPAGGVPAGTTVIVSLVLRGTTAGTVGASDPGGNSYSIDADVTGNGLRTVMLSSRLDTALAAGDTITVSHSFSDDSQGISAAAFTGISSGTRVDATGTATGDSTSPSATAATGYEWDVLVGAVGSSNNRTYTEAAGWSTLSDVLANCGGAPRRATLHSAYLIVSNTGSYDYSPTISNGERWAEVLVAYRG